MRRLLTTLPLLTLAAAMSLAAPANAGEYAKEVHAVPRTSAYAKVAYLEVNKSKGSGREACSGVLVGPDVLLTAGHCVRTTTGKPYAMTAYLGAHFTTSADRADADERSYVMKCAGNRWHAPTQTTTTPRSTDWAVVELTKCTDAAHHHTPAPGTYLGGYYAIESHPADHSTFEYRGYPHYNDSWAYGHLYRMSQNWVSDDEENCGSKISVLATFNVDVFGGGSGGPLFHDGKVVGIQNARCDDSGVFTEDWDSIYRLVDANITQAVTSAWTDRFAFGATSTYGTMSGRFATPPA